jgi:hypothetical protein
MAPLTAQDRTTAELAVIFGSVALTLAAIGLYGVLSYGIARRTGEIAIRIALGAQRGRVISMILRETIGLVSAGLALGGGLAYAASRLIDSRLRRRAAGSVHAGVGDGMLLVALSAAHCWRGGRPLIRWWLRLPSEHFRVNGVSSAGEDSSPSGGARRAIVSGMTYIDAFILNLTERPSQISVLTGRTNVAGRPPPIQHHHFVW